jgi:hypothetical protein
MEIVGTDMLNTTLNNSINTFFGSSRVKVSQLINEMKVDKADFTSLMSKLAGSSRFNDFSTSQVIADGPLRKEAIVDLFRDSSARMKQLYNAANANSIVLDSMVSILGSEIEKVENDIQNLQLFIDNYEFISGKDDLYNANYLEKFDNNSSDYKYDGYDLPLVDRDSVNFPANGGAFIDSKSGTLKIGSAQSDINVIRAIKSIKIENNYSSYITNDSDFKNLFNDNLFDSWSVTVKSPIVLDALLSKYSEYFNYDVSSIKGAQTAVEVEFNSSIEMDTIKFNPNLGNDFQLLQVVVFNPVTNYAAGANSSASYKLLLNSSKVLSSSIEFSFEKSVVNKIIFIFNQSTYSRAKKDAVVSELNSKVLNSFVGQRLKERRESFSKIQDMSYWYFNRNFSIDGIKQNKTKDIEYYSYRFPQELHAYATKVKNELFKSSSFSKEDNPLFINSPIFIDLIKNMMSAVGADTRIFNSNFFINSNSTSMRSIFMDHPGFLANRETTSIDDPRHQFYSGNIGSGTVVNAIKNLLVNEPSDSYEYSFSLKSIDFINTNASNTYKACFISKKIPTDGQILGVKAKVELANSNLSTDTNYDLKNLTSYELSVSNSDFPSLESDWIPLAFNNQTIIDSEIIFFDITDLTSALRFPPRPDSILLYKDGMIVNPSKYSYSVSNGKLKLTEESVYSGNSIFCVYYEIDSSIYNPYELDFVKRNLYNESIKQYRNNNGLGQIFSRTNSDATIALDFTPYINKTFAENSRYDKYFGTIFQSDNASGYSPIKIKLSDGSFATNLTNYTNSAQDTGFSTSSNVVQFFQNGKNITFNKALNSSFTVYYEYVPYSLRFRFIMRKNILNLDIPGRADSVLLKMKTTYFDPYYDKLNYISKV